MKMVPSWKVRRELRRLIRQAGELPLETARRIYFRRYYDWVLRREIRTTQGRIPIGDEVCIYAIFPRNGVMPSHLSMLAALQWSGISPIVVSNGSLSDADRDQIASRSSTVIERPNVGYDFGAYRDGILSISSILNEVSALWLINDSVWYIPQETSWFELARDCDADLVSASSALPRGEIEQWDKPDSYWRYSKRARNFHYASYALHLRPSVFMRGDFLEFWRRLDIRNDKKRTVRRGEIGLTRFIKRRGLTGSCIYNFDDMDEELSNLGSDELLELAQSLVVLDEPMLEKLKEKVIIGWRSGESNRRAIAALVLFLSARQNPIYALAKHAVEHRGCSFMKKSPAKNDRSASILREILTGVPEACRKELTEEIGVLEKRSHQTG